MLLEPRAALAFGIAIHELTTNAVKFGALSVVEGSVAITWATDHGVDGEDLVLDWVERNGPPVTPPEHYGFGMTLIERGLSYDLSGEVKVEFAPAGVKATLRAPLRGRAVGNQKEMRANDPAGPETSGQARTRRRG